MIRIIAIDLNDMVDDNKRQELLPFILRAMGTATDDKAVKAYRKELSKQYMKVYNRFKRMKRDFYSKDNFSYGFAFIKNTDYFTQMHIRQQQFTEKVKMYEEELFKLGLEFLDKACNPLTEPNKEIIRRAKELTLLNS